MFLFIGRRRIRQIFGCSFSAVFIVHFHTLALAKIAERGAFGPSLVPSHADSLGAPVAFPIFRPPMVSVHRPKSTAEKERSSEKEHHHFPAPSFQNQSAVEGTSTTSAAGGSSLASSVVEEDENLSQEHEDEEELAFSPVQIFSATKVINDSGSGSSTTAVPFHRLGTFGTRQNGKDGSNWEKENPAGLIGHLSIDRGTEASNSTAIPTRKTIALNGNVALSSVTPQFPVFTGMGMEIIESGESEGERTTSAVIGSEKEDKWHTFQHKMQYNFTTEAKEDSHKSPEKPKNSSRTEETIMSKGIATTTNPGPRSIYTPPTIHIEPITKQTKGDTWRHNATMGTAESPTKPIGTTAAAEDEVTVDLLAMFTPSSELSSKTTAEKQSDAFGHQIGNRTTQKITKLTTMGPSEEIIPRPTIPKTWGKERLSGQQQNQILHTEKPTTEQQQNTPNFETTGAATQNEAPKTTPFQMTTMTTTVTTTTVAPTTATKTTIEQIGDGEMHTELTDGRITIGTKRKTTTQATTIGMPNKAEWLGSNHIQEGMEETMPTPTTTQQTKITTKTTRTTTTPSWSRSKNGGESEGAQPHKKTHLEKSQTEATEDNANVRLLAITGIIAMLFIVVGVGSICTGRYVRKSRQLHGKYRPAAYELQTTRPPPLTSSSMTFAPPNRMTNYNDPQQNRYEFGQIHQMPPPIHCPHQLTMNGNDGREERLI